MSDSNVELKSLSIFERKEYEELKQFYSADVRRLRQKKVFLGLAVVAFIAALAAFHFFEINLQNL